MIYSPTRYHHHFVLRIWILLDTIDVYCNLITIIEFPVNVFSSKIIYLRRLLKPATPSVRDQDSTHSTSKTQVCRQDIYIHPNSYFSDLSDSLNLLNSLNFFSIREKFNIPSNYTSCCTFTDLGILSQSQSKTWTLKSCSHYRLKEISPNMVSAQ